MKDNQLDSIQSHHGDAMMMMMVVVLSSVACDYNAGYQGAVAGLKLLSLQGKLKD